MPGEEIREVYFQKKLGLNLKGKELKKHTFFSYKHLYIFYVFILGYKKTKNYRAPHTNTTQNISQLEKHLMQVHCYSRKNALKKE